MDRRRLLTAMAIAPAAALLPAAPAFAETFPQLIDLPNGWRPEGIATGRGTSFYVGSLANGAIYRGDLRTGTGAILYPGQAGTAAVGLELDWLNRLWVCGGAGGGASVVDAATGEKLASYAFGGTFVNDAVATRDAVYFTDSQRGQLYRVPLGHCGELPEPGAAETIALPAGLGDAGAFNNGIERTTDGRLIIVQSTADRLYTFDPASGAAAQVDLGGASVLRGDGLLRRGHHLYVMRNRLNVLAKMRLSDDGSRAELVAEITDPAFDVPSTVAAFGPWIYAVNARFTTPPTPATPYRIVRVDA